MQMFRAQMPPGALLSLTVTVQADTMYAAYDLPAIVPHVDFIEYANEWMWYVASRRPRASPLRRPALTARRPAGAPGRPCRGT